MLELDRQYSLPELQSLIASPPQNLKREMQRKYYEAGIVAQTLANIFRDQKPIITIPDDSYQKAPDALVQTARWPRRNIHGVEIVTFKPHCGSEGLIKFFGRTKLAGHVCYPDSTIIVCDVQLPMRDLQNTSDKISQAFREWHRKIPYPIYLYSNQNHSLYLAKLH
jgi:hypothetical protein